MSIVRYYKAKSKTVCSFGTDTQKTINKKQALINDIKTNKKGIIEDAYAECSLNDRTLIKLRESTLPESEFEGNPIYGNILKYKEVAFH